jgi:ribosomal protein S18 acetylase RimI-like enzyme
LDDAQDIANLLNACAVERTGKPATNAQTVHGSMQTPALNLETDCLLAYGPRGKIAGFALVQVNPPSPLLYALTESHPQYWNKSIGTTLCRWVEERARRSVPELEAGARIALLQQRLSSDVAGRELLLREGYEPVRHSFRMVIDLDAPPSQEPVPEGIIIRPFIRESEGHALVRAMRESFRDSWGYMDRGFEMEYDHWMHILERDPARDPAPYWFVAVDGKEIAGFALCHPEMGEDPEMAWVYVVGVRPAWRRRGIGLALLQHSFGELYQAGKRKVSLEVDAENPTGATRLYEKAGMHIERRNDTYEKLLRPGKKRG